MGIKIDLDNVYAGRLEVEKSRQEVRVEMAELQERENCLTAELDDYDTAIRMLERLVSRAGVAEPASPISQYETDEDGGLPRGALRQYIETTLHTFARGGANVAAIRDHIRQRYKVEVQPNTVSVTLNRLKAKGVAKLDGQDWSPANVWRAEPQETPEIPEWLRDMPTAEPLPDTGGGLDDDIPF